MSLSVPVSGSSDYASWREVLRSRHLWTILLFCMAVWLHAVDTLVVATMIPPMILDLGGSRYVSWTIALYEMGTIVAGVSSAMLLGKFGLRYAMTLSGLVFSFGCFLSVLAPSMFLMLIGRAFQGLGGGALIALVFISIAPIFPSRVVPRAMALISLLWGGGAFLGPSIGGFFVTYATWRVGFLFMGFQALIVTLFIYFGTRGLLRDSPSDVSPVPVFRLFILVGVVYFVALAGIYDSIFYGSLLLFLAAILFVIFLRLDSGIDHLLPLRCFDFRTPQGSAFLMIFFLSMSFISLWSFGAILLVNLHDVTLLQAGYILACMTVGWSFFAILVSGFSESRDRYLIFVGISLAALCPIGHYFAIPHGPIWLIALLCFLQSGGHGIAWTFMLRRLNSVVVPSERSRVAGGVPTVQRFGFAVGSAFVGIAANWADFPFADSPDDYARVARSIFLFGIPCGLLSILAMCKFCFGRFPLTD